MSRDVLRLHRVGLLNLGQPLAIERDKINRIDEKRRDTAVTHRIRDDLPREGEQKARTLDHDHGLKFGRWDVLQAKNTGEVEFEFEKRRRRILGRAFHHEVHLELGFRNLLGVDVDLNVDICRWVRWLARSLPFSLGFSRRPRRLSDAGNMGDRAVQATAIDRKTPGERYIAHGPQRTEKRRDAE